MQSGHLYALLTQGLEPAWLPRGFDLPLLSSIRWDLAILIAVALGLTLGLR